MNLWEWLPGWVWWTLCGAGWLAAYLFFMFLHPCRGRLFQACRAWRGLFPWTLVLALISSAPLLVESAKIGSQLPWMVPAADPAAVLAPETVMKAVQRAVWSAFWTPWPERIMAWLGPLAVLVVGGLRARRVLGSMGHLGRGAYLALLGLAFLLLVAVLLGLLGRLPSGLGERPVVSGWIWATAALIGSFGLQFYLFVRAYLSSRGSSASMGLVCQSSALKALTFWFPLMLLAGFLWALSGLPQDGGIPLAVRAIGVGVLLVGAALPCAFALIDGGWLTRFLMGLRIPWSDPAGFTGIAALAFLHLLPLGVLRHWLVHSWEPCWARTLVTVGGHWLWHAVALWVLAAFALFFAGALQPGPRPRRARPTSAPPRKKKKARPRKKTPAPKEREEEAQPAKKKKRRKKAKQAAAKKSPRGS